ncbi:MAG TPA: hypothetical protein VF005_07450, partial [Acidimicrobiales bacterium]
MEPAYRGDDGRWQEAPPSTIEAISAALGIDEAAQVGPQGPPPVRVVRHDDDVSLPGPWELTLEDGTSMTVHGRLPPGVPC